MRANLLSGNWKRLRGYCYGCGTWSSNNTHRNCPRAGWRRGKPGVLWIDIVHMRLGCDKCKLAWKVEDNITYCPCGHEQTTTYSEGGVAIGATDRLIAADGDVVFVLQQTGAVVVGRRAYHGIGYTEETYRHRNRR